MHPIFNYELYIFDCDGVILDSNQLKIQAMKKALMALCFNADEIQQCTEYFSANFGKSRFHHVSYFVESILSVSAQDKSHIEQAILSDFSQQCQSLYLTAALSPGIVELITSLPGEKYVASGSEQNELRQIFSIRGLSQYFSGVFGSPTAKSVLLKNIVEQYPNHKAVMIGDAISDYEASVNNNIDFICYIPYSNVTKTMRKLAKDNAFPIIESWPVALTKSTL